jgi:hypothetical protein
MNDNFDLMCRTIGWGDPYGGLWFVGIEEAVPWRTLDEIADFRNRPTLRKHEINGHTVDTDMVRSNPVGRRQIRNYQSYIASELSSGGPHSMDAYRDERLWRDGSAVFQSNLYPLGKPKESESLPEYYRDLFGYGPNDVKEYQCDTKAVRFPLVRLSHLYFKPQATVCFGKGRDNWGRFVELFELTSSGEDGNGIVCYPRERMVFTPFFGRGMSYHTADEVIKQLSAWNVKLP